MSKLPPAVGQLRGDEVACWSRKTSTSQLARPGSPRIEAAAAVQVVEDLAGDAARLVLRACLT